MGLDLTAQVLACHAAAIDGIKPNNSLRRSLGYL